MAKIQPFSSINKMISSSHSKIWFCAHPEDYSTYLNSVAKDLFELHACTVYYDTEPTAEYDEQTFLSNLHYMNLFVMPVTSRLLNEPNRAINIELKYAITNGIPVLPLLTEHGLEDNFNSVCGTLHCLRLFDGASYHENLKKFLDEIFGKDNIDERIRGEFDASIFLSYRKVDKEYLPPLIRKIHGSDSCRDVAVWYDDFLSPGEDFNVEIKKALKNSDAFILAITPHLLDKNANGKKNYVVSEEYPKARDTNKKIIPIRMAPISQKKLEQTLNNHRPMPIYINSNNDEMITHALKDALKQLPLGKKAGTPEHDYLIGLAYLRGLVGEIDRDLAHSLIERAALHGNIEAMEQLVAMYKNGDGVAVNYHRSLQWHKRLVERRKQEYQRRKSIGHLSLFSNSVFDLVERLLKDDIKIYLEDLLKFARDFYVEIPKDGSTEKNIACLYAKNIAARCHKALAQYHYDHLDDGDNSLVKRHLLKALDLYEESVAEDINEVRKMNEEDESDEIFDDGIIDYFDPDGVLGLADVYELMINTGIRRESDGNADYRDKAANLLEQLIAIAEKRDSPERVVFLQMKLAQYRSLREQEQTLQSSLELFRSSVKKTSTIESKRDLISTLINMGNFRSQQSHLGANKNYPSILEKNKIEIIEKNYGNDYVMPPALTLCQEAQAFYIEAFNLCNEVAELTSEASDYRSLANLCQSIGNISKYKLDLADPNDSHLEYKDRYSVVYQDTIPYYNRAVETLEKLVLLTDKISDYNLLSLTRETRFLRTLDLHDQDKSHLLLMLDDQLRLLEIYKTLLQKTGNEKYESDVNAAYYWAGFIYEELGDKEKAAYYTAQMTFDPYKY